MLEHADPGTTLLRVASFVRDTLASRSAPDGLLERALERAGLEVLPTESTHLERFLHGSLLELAKDELGASVADSVREQLQDLLDIIRQLEQVETHGGSSSATSIDSESKPTVELRVRPFPIVLLIGPDPSAARRLNGRLASPSAVVGVDDAALLMRELRLLEHLSRMLIVDMRAPNNLLDAVVSEPHLVSGATIVLWGAKRGLERELRPQLPGAAIVRCAPEAEAEDLASIVRLGPAR